MHWRKLTVCRCIVSANYTNTADKTRIANRITLAKSVLRVKNHSLRNINIMNGNE